MYFIFPGSCESNQDTVKDGKIDAFLYFFTIVLVSLQMNLIVMATVNMFNKLNLNPATLRVIYKTVK